MTRTQDIQQRMVEMLLPGQLIIDMDIFNKAVIDHDKQYSKKHSYTIDPTYCSNKIKP